MSTNVKNNFEYYNVDEILKFHSQYYIIFGQRGNGKSFSVMRRCIDRYFNEGEEFVICKRYEDDMKPKIASTMLDDHIEYVREKYGYEIKFYRGKWYVYPIDTEGKLADCILMAHAMSISSSDKYKGSQYPKVKTIVLEEFMSMNQSFLNNELNLFVNLVSTVFRNRIDGKVFLLGNAIGRVNPYSKALNVRLDRMKQGSIVCREFKDGRGYKTSFTIHRCDNVDVFNTTNNTNKIVYNIFGNNGIGSMITSGEFETGVYRKECFNITLKNNTFSVPPSTQGKYHFIEDVGLETPIYIIYEGFIYRAILYNGFDSNVGFNGVVGFIEVDEIDNSTLAILVNSMYFLPNSINVVDFNAMDFNGNWYLEMLRKILQLVVQDKFIVESNEDGQNIVDSLIQCGLTELKNR